MGDSNNTTYRDKYSNGSISTNECMMHVGSNKDKTEIFIKYKDVNDGLTKAQVEKWVEIGNSLLFPAGLSEIKMPKSYGGITADNLKKYLEIKIEIDPTKESKQNDAKYVSEGELIQIGAVGKYDCRVACRILRSDLNPRYTKNTWGGWAGDFRLAETKENLFDYIVRTKDLDEPKIEVKPEIPDCYVITINYGSKYFKSYYHKLATLSFYRYLYSSKFYGLAKKVLHLVDLGVDPWTALYCALSESGRIYGNYYSLLMYPGLKTMRQVEVDLKVQNSVNEAFSVKSKNQCFFQWSSDNEQLLKNVETFVSKAQEYKPEVIEKFKCIYPTKTLIKDKEYEGHTISYGKVKIVGEDWVSRIYNNFRFQKVQ